MLKSDQWRQPGDWFAARSHRGHLGLELAAASKLQLPTLLGAAHDKQVPPEGVRPLYSDLGSRQKVFVDLACSSHNAL